MKFSSLALLLLLLSVSACNKSDGGSKSRPQSPGVQEPVTAPGAEEITETPEDKAEAQSEEYLLQVTGINFLPGGLEPCNIKDKLYKVSLQDEQVKHVVCRNSRVELSFTSDRGIISYEALDLLSGVELATEGTEEQTYDLSEARGVQKFFPQNPHGFSYLGLQDVTGIDPERLKELNLLNDKYTSLKEEELQLKMQGKRVPKSLKKEIADIYEQMSSLYQKTESN